MEKINNLKLGGFNPEVHHSLSGHRRQLVIH
jgi:hypothetical protein